MQQIHELPSLLTRFLRLVCPDSLFEEIEGDLIQRYNKDLRTKNKTRASIGLWWNVLFYLRPGILFRNRIRSLMSLHLLLNYYKTTSRILMRNKLFSFINISGLTIGITGAFLLFLSIWQDFTYDNFHPDADRIYTAYNRTLIDGEISAWDATPRILAPSILEQYPSVEKAVSFASYQSPFLFKVNSTHIVNEAGVFTEPDFLEIFSFPQLQGASKKALDDPASIILTESFAKKLFKDQPALGESVTISSSGYDFDFNVTAILKDLPENSQFSFDYLLPFSFLENLEGRDENWKNNSVRTFVKLREGVVAEDVNVQLASIVQEHTHDAKDPEIFLYPFLRTHLHGQFENGVESGGRIVIVRMLILLGVFLLGLAAINFINLSTARAAKRSKEIGIRKVNGARRSALIAQFLTESHILTSIAFLLSLLLVYLLLPLYNQLSTKNLEIPITSGWFWLAAFGITTILGLLAGFYPALALSTFKPSVIFREQVSVRGSFLRKGLVIFQFGIAITMIFSAVVVQKQIRFVQNRNSGYDKELLIYHNLPESLNRSFEAYRHELESMGLASSVSASASAITDQWSNTYNIEWTGKDPEDRVIFQRFVIDDQMVETAGFNITNGRNLDFKSYPSDSNAILVNQAAVAEMGMDDPLGESIKEGDREWTIVGVVEDFVTRSPFEKLQPMILYPGSDWNSIVHIRLAPNQDVSAQMEQVEDVFEKYAPEYPFDYRFTDVDYARKFSGIKKTEMIARLAGFIVILIACLGLYGLTLYIVQNRLKEVSIRRIFGGSVGSIVKLLGWKSVNPIIWAIILFSPYAWFSMKWWLQSFEYRTTLQLWDLFIAAGILLVISIVTVGYQIWNTSASNPAEVLRNE